MKGKVTKIEEVQTYMQEEVDVIFTQILSKKGIKYFGERDVAAVMR